MNHNPEPREDGTFPVYITKYAVSRGVVTVVPRATNYEAYDVSGESLLLSPDFIYFECKTGHNADRDGKCGGPHHVVSPRNWTADESSAKEAVRAMHEDKIRRLRKQADMLERRLGRFDAFWDRAVRLNPCCEPGGAEA